MVNHWEESTVLNKYAPFRNLGERLRSERHFLQKITLNNGARVIDVGSACGDLARVLAEQTGSYDFDYTGVEFSESLHGEALRRFSTEPFVDPLGLGYGLKTTFLNKKFDRAFCESALTRFDLLVATGFIQHCLTPYQIIGEFRSITDTDGLILFDLKFVLEHDSIHDINRAYCDHQERIPYTALNLGEFLRYLHTEFPHSAVEIFGYRSGVNGSVVLPQTLTESPISAHVLINLAQASPDARGVNVQFLN